MELFSERQNLFFAVVTAFGGRRRKCVLGIEPQPVDVSMTRQLKTGNEPLLRLAHVFDPVNDTPSPGR